MKASKAFIKPFEASQRKVKIKIQIIYFHQGLGCEGLKKGSINAYHSWLGVAMCAFG